MCFHACSDGVRFYLMKETLNARELGLEGTLASLKAMLVNQFSLVSDPSHIKSTDPLFSVGVGLSSLEGLELLALLEKKYGVVIKDLDYWVDESPTLEGVARYLIDNSPTAKGGSERSSESESSTSP